MQQVQGVARHGIWRRACSRGPISEMQRVPEILPPQRSVGKALSKVEVPTALLRQVWEVLRSVEPLSLLSAVFPQKMSFENDL